MAVAWAGAHRKRVIGRRASVVAVLALAVASPAAPAAVIDFDDLPAGTLVDEEYAERGVHFGPSLFPGESGAVTTIAKPQARSAPNVAGLAYDMGTDSSSSWIRFDEPQTQVSFYACRTGPAGIAPNVNARAYDSNGSQVADVQGVQCNLDGPLVPVTVTGQNMIYLNVHAQNSEWAIDDLEYARRPSVVTGAAGAVTTSGATLNGTVDPNGQATTYRFEYGTTTAYGSLTATQSAGGGNSPQSVSAPAAGLIPGTTYHYRLSATNVEGTTNGADQSFKTAGTAPTVQPPGCPQPGIPRIGTAGNDTIVGTAFSTVIQGRGGNDTLTGLAANDCLYGEDGNDRLIGGGGRDRLEGGSGRDNLSGSSGSDTIIGSSGNDRSSGSSGNDRITGGTGNDRLSGSSGDDNITGSSGSDRLTGSSGTDRITGGSGRDRISAGTGGDRVSARDASRDRVDCGSGRDRVTADRRDRVARNCERVTRR